MYNKKNIERNNTNSMMKRKKLIICIGIMLIMIVFSKYFAVNVQPSLPIGIYLKIPAKEIKKNDIVIFDLDKKYDKYYKTRKIKYPMKRIVADFNDTLEIKRNRITICNVCDQNKMQMCRMCGCMIPMKTTLKKASCPIGKW